MDQNDQDKAALETRVSELEGLVEFLEDEKDMLEEDVEKLQAKAEQARLLTLEAIND